jgi:hypothetical protein
MRRLKGQSLHISFHCVRIRLEVLKKNKKDFIQAIPMVQSENNASQQKEAWRYSAYRLCNSVCRTGPSGRGNGNMVTT